MADDALWLGGCSLADLADRFGTPLYVYDEATLRAAARRIPGALRIAPGQVRFAAKACSTIAVLRVLSSEGVGLDAVSAGEIEAGRRGGFSPGRIYLHGNAKTREDLALALDLGLAAVVVDNLDELEQLGALAASRVARVRVLLRANLDLDVDTHAHLQTSGRESKFGMSRDVLDTALDRLARSRWLGFMGLHTHPGSQIADAAVYRRALTQLNQLAGMADAHGMAAEEISIGGGWAVPYRPGDPGLSPEALGAVIRDVVVEGSRLTVEPGRALVARAAIALYRVVSVKRSPNGRVVAVDGGMGDNVRPALYGARYAAIRVGDPASAGPGPDRIVGRYCEEGDVLADGVLMPAELGEVVALPVSGAYQLSMASAYNLVPPPAVVMVSAGSPRLVRARATIDELLTGNM